MEFPSNDVPTLPIMSARTSFSYRMALRVTLKAIKQLEFMRISQRNKLSAMVCGPHVPRICQRVIFICGDT